MSQAVDFALLVCLKLALGTAVCHLLHFRWWRELVRERRVSSAVKFAFLVWLKLVPLHGSWTFALLQMVCMSVSCLVLVLVRQMREMCEI